MKLIINIIKAILGGILYLPHILMFLIQPKVTKRFIISDIYANTSSKGHYGSGDESFVGGGKLRIISGLWYLCNLLPSDLYFQSLFLYRLRKCKLRHLLYHRHFTLEIPLDTEIGLGLKYDHPFSTILNAKKIGNYCRIKNNITIGNKNDDETLRPVLGDNVYIGAGAIIIGKITIGEGSIIGAGAVVTKSIPPNSIVVGNPARHLS